jgi:hypothetical protein
VSTVLKKVEAWPVEFGGEQHSGWLPPNAVTPRPTPVERELVDVQIESTDGGYLLTWAARPSSTCRELRPPKAGDTWHQTIEDAETAARVSFGIQHEHWADISQTA